MSKIWLTVSRMAKILLKMTNIAKTNHLTQPKFRSSKEISQLLRLEKFLPELRSQARGQLFGGETAKLNNYFLKTRYLIYITLTIIRFFSVFSSVPSLVPVTTYDPNVLKAEVDRSRQRVEKLKLDSTRFEHELR